MESEGDRIFNQIVIRKCTPAEQKILRNTGRCPYDGSDRWLQGPSGGWSQNIECPKCGARFNISPAPFDNEVIRPPTGGTPNKLWSPPITTRLKLLAQAVRARMRSKWSFIIGATPGAIIGFKMGTGDIDYLTGVALIIVFAVVGAFVIGVVRGWRRARA